MGPRILIRGNVVWFTAHFIGLVGFNGAADFNPRKSLTMYDTLHTSNCFNGAADFNPRKLAVNQGVVRTSHASMGPRILIRGN